MQVEIFPSHQRCAYDESRTHNYFFYLQELMLQCLEISSVGIAYISIVLDVVTLDSVSQPFIDNTPLKVCKLTMIK